MQTPPPQSRAENATLTHKKTLRLPVRALVEYVLVSGDLGGGDFVGPGRALEGARAHRRIQQARPSEYISEVTISHTVEVDDFFLTISGRIDGLYVYPDAVIIDEIKTTMKSPPEAIAAENQVHWGQLKVYAYCYAVEHDLDAVETQLTYYQVETGATQDVRRRFSTDELTAFFNDLLDQYLAWACTLEEWTRCRDASIRALDFPFGDYRPGQRRMAVAVYRAIRDRGQLLLQAPTGIGKTMAALFPAVKAVGEGVTEKIFYLTARTTGRSMAEQAFDALRGKGLRLKSLTITAKEKICFCPDAGCSPEACEFARGYFDRINDAVRQAFVHDAFTRETIERLAQETVVCPFEFSLDLALWADCIICDYNYAFDPRVYLRRFFQDDIGNYTFLIDEAHNLVDRAREMFSAEIRKQPFLDLRQSLKGRLKTLSAAAGKLSTALLGFKKRCDAAGGELAEPDAPDSLIPSLEGFLKEAELWLVKNHKTAFRQEVLDRYFEAVWCKRVLDSYDERYATVMESWRHDVRLKLFCLDPSEKLREALKRSQTAVFFSATMTPLSYFRQIFGCADTAHTLALPSPFPPQNLCLLIASRLSTRYKDRDRTLPQVAQTLISFVRQRRGNYLLFFPSYRYMQQLHDTFQSHQPDADIIVQTSGMTEGERDEFLACFAHDNTRTLVGFAVMGGVFGEGIDLVGDRLTGAAVVGVGLPGICLERNLIRDHFAATHDAGFEFAYMYPGLNRVLQAAGRVIRSDTDRGAVLLIDTRFATQRYARLFPREWQPARVKSPQQLVHELRQFWAM